MGKKISLEIDTSGKRKTVDPRFDSRCCRPNMVVLAGYGDENFPFPAVVDIVVNSLSRLEDRSVETECGHGSKKKFSTLRVRSRKNTRQELGDLSGYATGPNHLIPQTSEPESAPIDATLFAAAEGLRLMMDDGKYEAIVAERFDDHADKVSWARDVYAEAHPELMPAIESLEAHLEQLRNLYLESLPRVLSVLEAQNPEVPEHALLDAAIDSLDEELSPILDVLRIWTDAFGQARSGNYRQLDAVVFAVKQAFLLYDNEKPIGPCERANPHRIKTSKYKVGNAFVARASDQGPATVPGGRGPIGAHALEVPHDEMNIIALMLVLYMHEFRHDFFHDVEGLDVELTMAVANAIAEAVDSEEVVLSKEKVNVGRNKVPLRDLLMKLFADTIGEVDADISGGVLLSGPAYLFNMVSTFSAFNAGGESVFNKNRLLRTGSFFGMHEISATKRSIQFWPHPPDYIRAYIVAAALEQIGFVEEANQCRALADQAVGEPTPEHIVWKNEDPESTMKIRIPVDDVKAIAPVVAKALIQTKLDTLDGLSTVEIINWTRHRQEKVDLLVKNLMAGSSDIPKDEGDFYATYVAAAATLAYWGLVKSGVQARRAAKQVNTKALEMIFTIKERFDEAERVATLEAEKDCESADEATLE